MIPFHPITHITRICNYRQASDHFHGKYKTSDPLHHVKQQMTEHQVNRMISPFPYQIENADQAEYCRQDHPSLAMSFHSHKLACRTSVQQHRSLLYGHYVHALQKYRQLFHRTINTSH